MDYSRAMALTEAVIVQLRERLPEVLASRNLHMGSRIVLNIPPGSVERVQVHIEYPPEIIEVRVHAQCP